MRGVAGIQAISPLPNGTYTIRIDTYFPFKPGQAIQVQIPGDVKARYFSIASSPTEAGSIAFTAKADDGTPLAAGLRSLKAGVSTIGISGPWGSFALPEPQDAAYCFLAAGTGVTPFRSMIKSLQDQPPSPELRLFHCVRREADLLFREEFAAWSSPRFVYLPFVTGDAPGWKGARGRLSPERIKESLPAQPPTFFLCGPPGFVGDMEELLRESLQIAPDRIRREQW